MASSRGMSVKSMTALLKIEGEEVKRGIYRAGALLARGFMTVGCRSSCSGVGEISLGEVCWTPSVERKSCESRFAVTEKRKWAESCANAKFRVRVRVGLADICHSEICTCFKMLNSGFVHVWAWLIYVTLKFALVSHSLVH